MKAFISYSLSIKDEFILTLLSFKLEEEKIIASLSQNITDGVLDFTTKNEIDNSNIFIGIILEGGNEKKRVFNEWNYASGKNIPNLLLIEDNAINTDSIEGNHIVFNRSKVQSSIYEIKRKMTSTQEGSVDSDGIVPWIIAGEAIISTLSSAFPSPNQSQAKYVISGRLKLIEQQLLTIDSAAFQNLCDIYLALREQELASINRTGSQFGKQKTVKGTPDTFFRLQDGSLCYVEYTTKTDGLVEKIKDDIDKCIDPSKTGVPAKEVHKIIICFNSRLTVAEETEITKHANSINIHIELIGLDWLALEIYSKYLILAKDILGIPLDTGQLLPLQTFIDEYNNKGGKLTTPLDNIFLHRKKELAEIEDLLATNDLLILSGFPGVGKTKIALEALNKFLLANKNYSAFAVSKKDQDISEDLKIHLQQDNNYVLLVDDANRQLPNFKQIIGIFREPRKGNIKLIITVRDYALNDVTNECFEFDPHKIVLKKFTDDEITELISSDSFEIRNPKYQKRIVELTDGNARLAVMAARLAREKQTEFLYGAGGIYELYDYYFRTFIKDFDIFQNIVLIKTLGIISFLFTIDRSNKQFIETILTSFGMDYHDFNEAIDELEKRELLEVHYNNARVSEQVMGIYFFYKVFIKDEILSFKTLLFTFFPVQKQRFSDTIIPSNNSFGYENVLNKISNALEDYLKSVYNDEEKVLEFFSQFWFYKREETLSYFHQKIKVLPEPEDPIYSSKYETNDFVWDRDKTLDFLSNFFNQFSESFIPALELAFEYCRKKPQSLSELIRRIREKLLFDDDDHRNNFYRQVKLFNLLITKFKEKLPHYVEAFFALSSTFLSHFYQITKGERKHSITFYQYPLPFYEVTRDFRKIIWTTLFENFDVYPKEIFSIIKNFQPGYKEIIPEILEYDLSLLLPFIESRLNPSSFEHIYFVHDFVARLDREKLSNRNYQKLKAKFYSKEYDDFRKLDWNTLRGKQDYEFEKFEDFKKLKEQDIRTSFVFKSSKEFSELHNTIRHTLSVGDKNIWGIYESLNLIAEENFLQNNEVGFQLLESILNNYPTGLNPLYKPIKTIVTQSEKWAFKLWNLIKAWKHEYKLYWQLSFFDYLPIGFVNDFYKTELLETINSIDLGCYLQFESFEKFRSVDEDIIIKILLAAVEKIEKLNLRITLSFHFFEKYSILLSGDYELLTKAYIQQEKLNNYFDLNKDGLKTLVQINPKFLTKYISFFYTDQDWHNRNTDNHLPFIWDLENHDSLIEEVANLIIENNPYLGIGDYSLNILFSHLEESQMSKAHSFILNFISKYNKDTDKMNAIFDVLRQSLNEFFEDAFLHFLSLNIDIDDFKKIWWIGNGGTFVGDVIFGDIQAKEWQRILTIVDKSNNQLELIPIKTYIKKQIEYELKNAEEERKRKFINPDNW